MLKYFQVPVDYEIKYHKTFSTLKRQTVTLLQHVRMRKRTYSAVRGGPRVQESITTLLPAYLSVLLSIALAKINLDGCSLDCRPFRNLLHKSIAKKFVCKIG